MGVEVAARPPLKSEVENVLLVRASDTPDVTGADRGVEVREIARTTCAGICPTASRSPRSCRIMTQRVGHRRPFVPPAGTDFGAGCPDSTGAIARGNGPELFGTWWRRSARWSDSRRVRLYRKRRAVENLHRGVRLEGGDRSRSACGWVSRDWICWLCRVIAGSGDHLALSSLLGHRQPPNGSQGPPRGLMRIARSRRISRVIPRVGARSRHRASSESSPPRGGGGQRYRNWARAQCLHLSSCRLALSDAQRIVRTHRVKPEAG